jgi:ribosome modulation factor
VFAKVGFQRIEPQHHISQVAFAIGYQQRLHDASIVKDTGFQAGTAQRVAMHCSAIRQPAEWLGGYRHGLIRAQRFGHDEPSIVAGLAVERQNGIGHLPRCTRLA